MNTRPIETIELDEHNFNQAVLSLRENRIKEQLTNLDIYDEYFGPILDELSDILTKQENWVKIRNQELFFNSDVCALFPNFQNFVLGYSTTIEGFANTDFKNTFGEYVGDFITEFEFEAIIYNKIDFLNNNLGFKLQNNYYYTIVPDDEGCSCVSINNINDRLAWGEGHPYSYPSYHIPIYRLFDTNCPKKLLEQLMLLLRANLMPDGFSEEIENKYKYLLEFYKISDKFFYLIDGVIVYNQNEFIRCEELPTINGVESILFSDVQKEAYENLNVTLFDNSNARDGILKTLLSCDYVRADIEEYDEKILSDPNRGHWDLWEDTNESESRYSAKLETPLIARNPASDIKFDGIIGIDFGTKSTVVVYQEDTEHSMPMRIGTGKLSKEIQSSHYENPTVLEFIDFTTFIEAYNEKEGRPNTLWEYVTTSHTAFDSFLNSSSNEYYSYLYELKQWAGDKSRKIRMRDKQDIDVILPSYTDIKTGDFDPIELYAYFIGLYINNMHNGIYLDYLLSYPVAYEKNIRDKMIESFTKGLKKSLPQSILDNSEIMSNFRVSIGASEPVAYSICALEEYGFEPTGNEKVFYSVFDFGGGTTDFDFGTYIESRERRYDYITEIFGSGGDQYLGGENILELLAFEVFKKNQDVLRNENITFILPPEIKKFLGSETLLSDSQEAKLNTAQLMEKLRCFWERTDGYDINFKENVLKVNLFNVLGEQILNVELTVDELELTQIIYNRIEKGVRNFFEGLVQAFKISDQNEDIKDIGCINIFLAGNSSKSPILRDIFDTYIAKYNKLISDLLQSSDDSNYFEVFPPLGTDEAKAIQQNKGITSNNGIDIEKPTGKTGVAFGLIKGRLGGKIKMVTEKAVNEEIKFNYFIGYEKKQKFSFITDRNIIYNKWYECIDATEEDFTLFYSKLPEALTGNLSIKEVSRKKCRLQEIHEDAYVYYRAVSPSSIEYVVATASDISNDVYLSDINLVELD